MKKILYCASFLMITACGSSENVEAETSELTDQENQNALTQARYDYQVSLVNFATFKMYVNQSLDYLLLGAPDAEIEKSVLEWQDKSNKSLENVKRKHGETVYKDSAQLYLDSVVYYRDLMDTAQDQELEELGM